jgi:hypothetical protein
MQSIAAFVPTLSNARPIGFANWRVAVSKSLIVFGTSHQVQGAKGHPRNVDDPTYSEFIEGLICGYQIDFLFEEASGLGPTTAEGVALLRLGAGHYLDVDPHRDKRSEHGLAAETGSIWPIDPCDPRRSLDVAVWEFLDEHAKRESFWLQRLTAQNFTRGLFVCGYLHTLSFAYVARSEGFKVTSLYYMPHHKLCTKQHLATPVS